MPRSPTVYSLPAGTTVAPNTTIQSSWANALTADIEQTFNTPQPIVYGGTGAATAGAAADALSPDFANVASGATTNIGAATSPNVNITGTTTITAFDTVAAGIKRFVKFAGALTLTHNATSLILPGAANITTAAGDTAIFVSEGSGNWRCLGYQRANGSPVSFANAQALAGSVVASSTNFFSTYTSITDTIPNDDTIPQITEGDPVFSVNFTPLSTTNKLRIRAMVPCSANGLQNVTAALHVGGGTDAVQMDVRTIPAADYFEKLVLEYEYTPGSVSAQNVRINCGPGAGTMYINGTTAGRRGGGAMSASLVIEEIKA